MKRMIIFLAACLIGGTSVRAGGFEQPNQSAAAAGVANAFVATADGASALGFNPSGIAWLSPGVHIEGGGYMDYRDSSVRLPSVVAPNEGIETLAGSFFAVWVPASSRFSAGWGMAPLYQVTNNWEKAFPGAAGVSGTSGTVAITAHHATADIVYAINSSLSMGLGADWYVTRVTMRQGTAPSFVGDDFAGFGGHVSMTWKPMPAWSIGLMARSGASVNISANAGEKMAFKLPDQFSVGIAHDFADVWRLETDVKWTRWSSLKDLNVTSGAAIVQLNQLDLRDTLNVMAGLTWTWRENSQFRIGYAYEQAASRNTTFNPALADQDGHRISLGFGADLFDAHMDLAYQYVFYKNRTVTGPYAGTYRDRRQTLMLSGSKTFE